MHTAYCILHGLRKRNKRRIIGIGLPLGVKVVCASWLILIRISFNNVARGWSKVKCYTIAWKAALPTWVIGFRMTVPNSCQAISDSRKSGQLPFYTCRAYNQLEESLSSYWMIELSVGNLVELKTFLFVILFFSSSLLLYHNHVH